MTYDAVAPLAARELTPLDRFPGIKPPAAGQDQSEQFSIILASPAPAGAYAGKFDHLIATLAENAVTVIHCADKASVQRCLRDRDCSALLLDIDPAEANPALTDHDLGEILAEFHRLRVVALTPKSAASPPQLQSLLRLGWLYDFHTIPVDERRLLHCLGHIHGLVSLQKAATAALPVAGKPGFGHLIGTSAQMQQIYDTIRQIAPINTPILITGESGTGKELVARTIHEHSAHASGNFVAINCAALPAALIESELFGYEAGAFTGAQRRKRGRVEDAHEGTLFLDEIGDMPPDLQPHFLHFLQDNSFKRVGGTTSHQIKTRVIAATNVDLKKAMTTGSFRADLFYRLNVLFLEIPPLRERDGDKELLAKYYLKKICKDFHRPPMQFSRGALLAIACHPWPGNVRELVSAISRAVVMAKGRIIRPAELGLDKQPTTDERRQINLAEGRRDFDRQFISACLSRNRHNIGRAAKELDISRVGLYRLIKRHAITHRTEKTNHDI